MSDDKCTCGANKVPGTEWCYTCNPKYPIGGWPREEDIVFGSVEISENDLKPEAVRRATMVSEELLTALAAWRGLTKQRREEAIWVIEKEALGNLPAWDTEGSAAVSAAIALLKAAAR